MTNRDEPQEHSQTAHILDELQLYGFRPYEDEPDSRPLPEGDRVAGAIADIFDALVGTLAETRLEPDLDDLLWSAVNLFHRAAERVERELDDNEQAQRRSQREQDGSEVASVELERLLAQGLTLIERRNAHELMRDTASQLYRTHTGSAWRPRHGSLINRRALTAAVVDSRDFIAARRRAETEVMLPAGAKVAFTGGKDCNDTDAIWAALDRVRAKHPDMVLLHGGAPSGAERIAACWADSRKVTQVAFKPDWSPPCQGRAVQAQRCDAGRAADRRRGVPRHRHSGQPRRQGAQARYPAVRLPQTRRVSAAFANSWRSVSYRRRARR